LKTALVWIIPKSTNEFIEFILKEAHNVVAFEVAFLSIFIKGVILIKYAKEQTLSRSKAKFT